VPPLSTASSIRRNAAAIASGAPLIDRPWKARYAVSLKPLTSAKKPKDGLEDPKRSELEVIERQLRPDALRNSKSARRGRTPRAK
jgi:hypothetical protein